MKKMKLDLVLELVLVALFAGVTVSTLPGFKIRLSQRGIEYANTVAHTFLAKELKSLQIPNQNGKDGHIEWSLTSIQNRGCTIPSSNMALAPAENGLTWTMQNLGIDLHADWRVKYKKWIHISTSGTVDLNVKGVSVQVIIHLAEQTGGRPSISLARCSASVGDVDVHFHGGTAFILNLFRHLIGNKIKDLMQKQICNVVAKEINVDGNQKLSQIKVNVEIDRRFLLNYSLVSSPKVNSVHLETEHKGETFWKGDVKEAPFSPKPIPALADNSRMLYLWATDYIANSFAYTAQQHNYLQYNLTDNDLPASNRSYFNTTCKLFCIGKLIPQMAEMYPNAKVEAIIKSLSTPSLAITAKSMTVTALVETDLYARTPDKRVHYMITLKIKVSLSVKGEVVNERLTGEITGHSENVDVVKSAIGTVNQGVLNLLLKGALNLAVIPELNTIMKKGVDIPVTGSVSFQNTQLTLLNNSFMIATDLKYQEFSTLNFKSESQP